MAVSNFPFTYQVTWLQRLLIPSMSGERGNPLPAVSSPAPKSSFVRLAFIGDISAVANTSAPTIDQYLRTKLASADLVIGNCESPVVEKPRAPFATRVGRKHAMTVGFLAHLLAAASVPPDKLVLSLANNHALDQAVAGLDETREALAELDIRTVGTFGDCLVPTVRAGPLSIAVAAFTEWRNASADDFDNRIVMAGDMCREGFAALRETQADLVCALPHWDQEFRHFPQSRTRALARQLVDNGVGLIAGHHAHVLQPIEVISDSLVAFGLGDFVGTAWPRVRWPLRIGAILFVDIGTGPDERGKIVGHEVTAFFRNRTDGAEHLAPVMALGNMRRRVEKRLFSILGDAPD